MPSSLGLDIRGHLAKYLVAEESLDVFKDRVIDALLDAEQQNDVAAEEFAYDIMLPMAEESGGYITEERLREALQSLLGPTPAAAT